MRLRSNYNKNGGWTNAGQNVDFMSSADIYSQVELNITCIPISL